MVRIGDGGGRAVPTGTPPAISITPVAPAIPYFERRPYAETVIPTSIDDLIEQYTRGKNLRQLQGDPVYQNMLYIAQHAPMTAAQKETTTNDILNGILDAIGYASTIASFVPYPPFQIGGMLGYSASNAARSFLRGDNSQGLRELNYISRNLYRMRRQNEVHSKKMEYYGKSRRR